MGANTLPAISHSKEVARMPLFHFALRCRVGRRRFQVCCLSYGPANAGSDSHHSAQTQTWPNKICKSIKMSSNIHNDEHACAVWVMEGGRDFRCDNSSYEQMEYADDPFECLYEFERHRSRYSMLTRNVHVVLQQQVDEDWLEWGNGKRKTGGAIPRPKGKTDLHKYVSGNFHIFSARIVADTPTDATHIKRSQYLTSFPLVPVHPAGMRPWKACAYASERACVCAVPTNRRYARYVAQDLCSISAYTPCSPYTHRRYTRTSYSIM